jgi:hypothetical protein
MLSIRLFAYSGGAARPLGQVEGSDEIDVGEADLAAAGLEDAPEVLARAALDVVDDQAGVFLRRDRRSLFEFALGKFAAVDPDGAIRLKGGGAFLKRHSGFLSNATCLGAGERTRAHIKKNAGNVAETVRG